MQFVDEAKIKVFAGHGGAGAVSFRREIYVPQGGPDGGNGGDGGDVILRGSSQVQTLLDLKLHPVYRAKSGDYGTKRDRFGARGDSCVIQVPVGTLVYDADSGTLLVDLVANGQEFAAAKGGKGGLGNASFATASRRTPRFAQPGMPGEERTLRLEIRLIAEVGLVGMPNAGKSTLLKCLTNASPKIADYPFTTLRPNLGVLRALGQEVVIADIPGLIEGASHGIGLGHQFLRHVDRTRLLVIMIAASEDIDVCWKDYEMLLNELAHSPVDLSAKGRLVVLSKSDTVSEDQVAQSVAFFAGRGVEILPISSFSRLGIPVLEDRILRWSHGEAGQG